jgi:hypothetical protein
MVGVNLSIGRATASFSPRLLRFQSEPGHVGFVVDKVALWKVFS